MSSRPGDLSEAIYCKIGTIIVRWSLIESLLERIILRAQGIPELTGLVITSSLGSQSKSNLVRAILNSKTESEPPRYDEAFELLKRIDDVRKHRNDAAHFAWFPGDSEDEAKRMVIRVTNGRLREIQETVTVSKLEEITEELLEIGRLLHRWDREGRFLTKDSQ